VTCFRGGHFGWLTFVAGISGDLLSWREFRVTCFRGGNFGWLALVAGIWHFHFRWFLYFEHFSHLKCFELRVIVGSDSQYRGIVANSDIPVVAHTNLWFPNAHPNWKFPNAHPNLSWKCTPKLGNWKGTPKLKISKCTPRIEIWRNAPILQI